MRRVRPNGGGFTRFGMGVLLLSTKVVYGIKEGNTIDRKEV